MRLHAFSRDSLARASAWHGSYAMLGLVQMGMAPILLPMSAPPGAASGLSYAAFALAGLASPAIGGWADRTRRNRLVFVSGLLLAAGAMLGSGLLQGRPCTCCAHSQSVPGRWRPAPPGRRWRWLTRRRPSGIPASERCRVLRPAGR